MVDHIEWGVNSGIVTVFLDEFLKTTDSRSIFWFFCYFQSNSSSYEFSIILVMKCIDSEMDGNMQIRPSLKKCIDDLNNSIEYFAIPHSHKIAKKSYFPHFRQIQIFQKRLELVYILCRIRIVYHKRKNVIFNLRNICITVLDSIDYINMFQWNTGMYMVCTISTIVQTWIVVYREM